MIQDFIKKVGEFHDVFGVKRGNVDVELRYKLFKEEFEEYKDAKTLVDKADAIVDMLYIACGTLDVYGWSSENIDKEIAFSEEFDCLIDEELNINGIEDGIEFFIKEQRLFTKESIVLNICDLARHNNIYDKLPQLFKAVHESNMSKLDDNGKPIINDGILDPSKPIGKILKGKNYFEPRLKEILENGN